MIKRKQSRQIGGVEDNGIVTSLLYPNKLQLVNITIKTMLCNYNIILNQEQAKQLVELVTKQIERAKVTPCKS